MKVAQILVGLYPGGVTTHVKLLSEGLIKKGNEVIVICQKGDNSIESELHDIGVNRYYVDFNINKNPIKFIRALFDLKSILLKEKIDIIHSHYRIPNIYIEILRKIKKIPYVWTYHLSGVDYSGISKVLSFHGDRTIAVSVECKDDLIRRFKLNEKDVDVVLNGIKLDEYISLENNLNSIRKKYDLPDTAFVISILARVIELKGQKEAVMNLEKVIKKYNNVYLIIAGGNNKENLSEYEREVLDLIDKLGITSNVRYVGFRDPKEIISISNLTLMCSVNEGFGIVCVESMAMGVPVLRTKTAGWQEVEGCCELVEIGDMEELIKRVELFIKNEINTELLCSKAFKFVEENCTIEIMTDRVIEVYNSVLKK